MQEIMPIIERPQDFNGLIISISGFVVLLLVIFIKLYYADFYRNLLYRLAVENLSGREIEQHSAPSIINTVSFIEAFLSISTMIFAIVQYSNIKEFEVTSKWNIVFWICIFMIAYNSLRIGINAIIGKVFRLQKHTSNYNTLIIDLEKALGIAYIPFFIFTPFISHTNACILVYCAIFITLLLFAYQYVTFFLHLLKNKFFNHYSFLYFCALEVVPILILIKFIL